MKYKSFAISGIIFSSLLSYAQQPNILVLIADDAGVKDFGCYGNKGIKTPNIDKLASEGLLCEKAFLTSSQSSPSRTSILSGKFAHTIGTEDLHQPLDSLTKLLPYYLRQKGYFTGIMIKKHIGKHGIDQFDHVGDGDDRIAPKLFRDFLDKAGDNPFFGWMAFIDPHRDYGGEKGAKKVHNPEDVTVPPYFIDSKATREEIALYYDEIHRLDFNIGEMITELKKRNKLNNTLIVFLSDNGMPFLRCKATLYDYGIQTPLIFYWKGKVTTGARYSELISVIDLAPTLLDVAGINKPSDMYGKSIKGIFKDQSLPGRDYIFAERNWHDSDEHMRCIRTKNYKYILNAYPEFQFPITGDCSKSNAWFDLKAYQKEGKLNTAQKQIFIFPRSRVELYNVQEDPNEINNLIMDRPLYQTAMDLNNLLLDWSEETNDYPSYLKRKDDMIDRESGFFFNVRYYDDYKKFGYYNTPPAD